MRLIPLFVIIPLVAAFLHVLIGRRQKLASDAVSLIGTLGLFLLSLAAAQLIRESPTVVFNMGGWKAPLGICLVVDGLSSFMLLIVNLVSVIVMLYAARYIKIYTDPWKFHTLFMLMLAGLNGMIISGDLFNLYLFLEISSLCGYCLVAFGVEAEHLEASFKYAIMGSLASLLILLGIALVYSYTSTLHLADISAVLSQKMPGMLIGFVSILFLTGFGLKAALVPFHAWLADAHSSAPTPVSAMLSGVFIKTTGVYALCRIFFNVIGVPSNILLVFMVGGILSMTVGAFLAIAQTDIKRMFAYSSVSQIGYILLALGIGTPLAVLGGLFHLLNHAIFKSLLFLNAGAIEYATGERDIRKLGGLHSKMPVTGYTGLAGAMGISGIPPFGGFWSKLIIIIAAVQSGHPIYACIALLISVVTLAYYLKFQTLTFWGSIHKDIGTIKSVPVAMKSAMIILALLCLITGLLLVTPSKTILYSAVNVLLSGKGYSQAVVLGAR